MEENGFRYKFLKNRVRVGRYIQGVLGGAECEPYKVMRAWRENGKNKGGFHVTEMYTNNGKTPRTRHRSNVKVLPGVAKIGEGVDGISYVGCYDDKCKDQVAIKAGEVAGLRSEFNMLKTLKGISPHIQHAYFFKNCGEKSIPLGGPALLYTEYAHGGSLRNYIAKYGNRILPDQWRSIIFQILWTLQAIAEKYPSFRHNDLHLDNIFIDDTETNKNAIMYKPGFKVPNTGIRVIIGDFGFAYMDKNGLRNPKVVSKEYKDEYGIYPGSDPLYDAFFFLNSILEDAKEFPRANETVEFIRRIIPAAYRNNTNLVKKFRLRAGVKVDIPPLRTILNDKFFKVKTNAKVIDTVNTAVTLKAPKKKSSVAAPVKRQMRKKQKEVAAVVGKIPTPPKTNVTNKFAKGTNSPKLRPMRRRPRVVAVVGKPTPAIRNKIQELFKNENGSPGYKKPKMLTPQFQRLRRLYPNLTNAEFRAEMRQEPVGLKPLARGSAYKTPNVNTNAYKTRMQRATRPFTPSPTAKPPTPKKMISNKEIKKVTEKKFGPPATMKMNNKATWWRNKVGTNKKTGKLKIGGKSCGSHKKDVIEEAARAMGVVVPKKATKDVICALIAKKIRGSPNNSNNNL